MPRLVISPWRTRSASAASGQVANGQRCSAAPNSSASGANDASADQIATALRCTETTWSNSTASTSATVQRSTICAAAANRCAARQSANSAYKAAANQTAQAAPLAPSSTPWSAAVHIGTGTNCAVV